MFELPSFGSTPSWNDTSNYSLSGNNQSAIQSALPEDNSWFTDSTSGGQNKESDSIFGGAWDWVKSDQGTSVIGGALGAIGSVWAQDRAIKAANKNANYSSKERAAQVARHNTSINAPNNPDILKLKRENDTA